MGFDTDFGPAHTLSSRPENLTIVTLAQRPGARRYVVRLEYEYFTPGTAANADYDIFPLTWQTLAWFVVIIPITKKDIAWQLADACAVRLSHATPMVINSAGRFKFPIAHRRAFTVENIVGSRVYQGHDAAQRLAAEEQEWLSDFFRRQRGE